MSVPHSLLEVVPSQPLSSRDDDYSRLELSGHLDLGPPQKPPHKPPPYDGRNIGWLHMVCCVCVLSIPLFFTDYENLAHVAHPDTGDYSNLKY